MRRTRTFVRAAGAIAVAAAFAVGTVGCGGLLGQGCNDVGCLNGLFVEGPTDLAAEGAYDVEVCVDGDCWREVLEVPPSGEEISGLSEGVLTVYFDLDAVSVDLPDGDLSGSHDVTVQVRTGTGQIVMDVHEPVEFTVNQPNGSGCSPTCWYAKVST